VRRKREKTTQTRKKEVPTNKEGKRNNGAHTGRSLKTEKQESGKN